MRITGRFSFVIPFIVVSAQLPSPPAIQDIYSTQPLWRFENTALWDDTYPYYKDPRQARLNDCWLPASSIAVAWVNPVWISHRFFFPDGYPMHGHSFPSTEWAIVNLWNPSNGALHNFTVNAFNRSLTEDYPGGNWWHSAVTQGFQQMAARADIYGIDPDGTIWKDYGIPAVALAMLTGQRVTVKEVWEYPHLDSWWDDMQHAQKSPIVITTIDGENIIKSTPEIIGNHAYAVLMVEQKDDGTERRILLRNPWGDQKWYEAVDVFKNVYYVNFLDGFKELVVET